MRDQFFVTNALNIVREGPDVVKANDLREDNGHFALLSILAMHFK